MAYKAAVKRKRKAAVKRQVECRKQKALKQQERAQKNAKYKARYAAKNNTTYNAGARTKGAEGRKLKEIADRAANIVQPWLTAQLDLRDARGVFCLLTSLNKKRTIF